MEARLTALNLSHYAAALRAHEIDDDILKLMTVADLREAGLDAAAAQRLHADVAGVAAPNSGGVAAGAPKSGVAAAHVGGVAVLSSSCAVADRRCAIVLEALAPVGLRCKGLEPAGDNWRILQGAATCILRRHARI